MPSSPQDAATQSASSKAALSNNSVLTDNAAQNQTYANNTRSSLFGTYDPVTNSYSGGSESSFLNPDSMTTKDLSGTFLNQYNNQTDALAKSTKDAVGTTMQNLASRGMGATPAGFAADQERKAYEDQATTQGNDYAAALAAEHAEAVNNFNSATANFANSGTGAQSSALTAQGTAAGSNDALYSTSSTQKASPWATALGAVAGAAGGAGSLMTGIKK